MEAEVEGLPRMINVGRPIGLPSNQNDRKTHQRLMVGGSLNPCSPERVTQIPRLDNPSLLARTYFDGRAIKTSTSSANKTALIVCENVIRTILRLNRAISIPKRWAEHPTGSVNLGDSGFSQISPRITFPQTHGATIRRQPSAILSSGHKTPEYGELRTSLIGGLAFVEHLALRSRISESPALGCFGGEPRLVP